MFQGRTGGTPVFVFMAFTCLNELCASRSDGDLEILSVLPYSYSFGGAPTTDLSFELEYQGGGVFRGTFNGEILTLNLPALGATVFNENDFLHGRLQSQGMFMYDGADSVAVTAVFDDIVLGNGPVPGIAVTPTGGLLVNEIGTSDTFTVVLTAAPNADVTIALSSSDTGEATVSPASLNFTTTNWNVPQTVTVTGVDDIFVDGNTVVTIVTAAAVSADTTYNGLNPADVSVTVADDDTAGIALSVTALTTSESGGSASFNVVLSTPPTANVTVAVTSSNTSEGIVSPASLTFTTANWSTPQAVIATGVDDSVDDGDITYTISTSATSVDAGYNGLAGTPVTATNLDDDTVGITVTPVTGLETREGGATASFTVVLTSEPVASVSIPLASSNAARMAVSPASLTFTAANWATQQTVTVSAVDNGFTDGNITATALVNAATSTDTLYNGIDALDVSTVVFDNESTSVFLTATPDPTTVFNTVEDTYFYFNNLVNGVWHAQSNQIIVGHYVSGGYWSHATGVGGYTISPDNDTGQLYSRIVHMPATNTIIHTDQGHAASNANRIFVGSIANLSGVVDTASFAAATYSDGFTGMCNLLSSSADEFLCFDGTGIRHYGTAAGSSTLTLNMVVSLSQLPNSVCPAGDCYGGTFAWDGTYYYFATDAGNTFGTGYEVYDATGNYVAAYTATGTGNINAAYFDWSVGRYSTHDGFGGRNEGTAYVWSGGSTTDDSQSYGFVSGTHSAGP